MRLLGIIQIYCRWNLRHPEPKLENCENDKRYKKGKCSKQNASWPNSRPNLTRIRTTFLASRSYSTHPFEYSLSPWICLSVIFHIFQFNRENSIFGRLVWCRYLPRILVYCRPASRSSFSKPRGSNIPMKLKHILCLLKNKYSISCYHFASHFLR